MSKQIEISFRIAKGENKRDQVKQEILDLLKGTKFSCVTPDSLKVISKSQGGAKSKRIGSDFERKVVKLLSEWWGSSFRRVPNSGGWDKQVKDGSVQAAGDIWTPPEANFPFCVECKHRNFDLDIFAEQKTKSDCIFDWWNQCTCDSLLAKKEPLLIMCCRRTLYVAFNQLGKEFSEKKIECNTVRCSVEAQSNYKFTIMLLEDFLTLYPKQYVTREN
jgi:hypothetical protein